MAAAKRSAPEPATSSRRRSGRLSSTPKKSNYFEDHTDTEKDETEIERPRKRGRPSKKDPPKVVKHETVTSEEYQEDENDNSAGDEEVSEEEYKESDGGDAEQDDEDDDNEVDEDAPMKVTIIPLEQLRDEGGVAYDDQKVHKNTCHFLSDLKANNKRAWLKSHDGEYRRALKDWNTFVEATTMTVIDIDETIPELPVKDVSFRIHRDIRFSKDPTPYKPHFSAAWSRTGRKGPYACYYIHLEPKHSFIGGGLWCPEKDSLARLRRSIDARPARWRRVLENPTFKDVFFPKVKTGKGKEDALVDAFFEKNKEYALKKRPQGYEITHRDIKLLRLKSFTVGKKIDESMLLADNAQEQVGDVIRGLAPFVEFLNSIVMPDPGADSSGSDEDGNQDEEDDDDEL